MPRARRRFGLVVAITAAALALAVGLALGVTVAVLVTVTAGAGADAAVGFGGSTACWIPPMTASRAKTPRPVSTLCRAGQDLPRGAWCCGYGGG